MKEQLQGSLKSPWGRRLSWYKRSDVLSLVLCSNGAAAVFLQVIPASLEAGVCWQPLTLHTCGISWCFHLLQPLAPACNPPRKPVRSARATCSGALVLWESVRAGELRNSWALWTSVKQTSVCRLVSITSGHVCQVLVMRTGRNILEWSTREPSIALAKGNQPLKLLAENLDTSLTILLTSAANSDMVVQSTGGTHRRKPPSPPAN